MKKSVVLAFLFVFVLGVSSAFALSDEEYRALVASSPEFKEADQNLGSVWKEFYAGLSEKDKKYYKTGQQQWVKKWRDDDAKKLMKNLGVSKAEAYTQVTRRRVNTLRILQHNSKLSQEEILAGQSWPDHYFEDWYQEQLKQNNK